MARGVDGREIFADREDREKFLLTLGRVARESSATLLAYCLMGNHFHLALKTRTVPLSAFMQRILTSHSLSFNRKYGRTGHLFQARYKAVLCLDQAYLACLIRYIHMNPVRAGLAATPDRWPWSSYWEYRRQGRDGLIDAESDVPDLDVPPPADFQPWPESESDISAALTRTNAAPAVDIKHLALACLQGSPVSMDAVRSRSRRREISKVRRLIVRRGVLTGYTLTSIAQWLGIGLSSAQHYLEGQ